jgi:hypothetical protein
MTLEKIFGLLFALLVFTHQVLGAFIFVGMPGSGKTTISNLLGGTDTRATGSGALPVSMESGFAQFSNIGTLDTVGFEHIVDLAEKNSSTDGTTYALMDFLAKVEENPLVSAIVLTHHCDSRLPDHLLAGFRRLNGLLKHLPVNYLVHFTFCHEAACDSCKARWEDKSQLERLLGIEPAGYIFSEKKCDLHSAACVDEDKMRTAYLELGSRLSPTRAVLTPNWRSLLLEGDFTTLEHDLREAYCSAVRRELATVSELASSKKTTIALTTKQLEGARGAALAPFVAQEVQCPPPNPELCNAPREECGGRRYGLFGPRKCWMVQYINPVCRQQQETNHQTCVAAWRHQQQRHDNNESSLKAQRVSVLETRLRNEQTQLKELVEMQKLVQSKLCPPPEK